MSSCVGGTKVRTGMASVTPDATISVAGWTAGVAAAVPETSEGWVARLVVVSLCVVEVAAALRLLAAGALTSALASAVLRFGMFRMIPQNRTISSEFVSADTVTLRLTDCGR